MSFNMPNAITQTSITPHAVDSFVYGPEHQRAKQTQQSGSTTTKTLYYAGAMEKEVTSSGTTLKTYLPSGIGVLLDNGTTVQTRYFLKDHLTSIETVAKEDGTVIERMSYDAWGKRRNLDGTDDTTNTISGVTDNKGYSAQEMLDNLRLVNMNGRVYDPLLGRFISADPFVSRPTDLQSLNRYAYVLNNPLALVDPTGYADDQPHQEQTAVAIAERDIQWDYATQGEPVQCFGNCIVNMGKLSLVQTEEERKTYEGGNLVAIEDVPLWDVYSGNTYLGSYNPATNHFGSAWDGFQASLPFAAFLTENFANSGWRMLSHAQSEISSFRNNAVILGEGELISTGVGAALAARLAVKGPEALLDLARQIAAAGTKAPWERTVALLETAEGPTLVGAGKRDLTAAQKALAVKLGLTVAEDMPGIHAEGTVLSSAGKMRLTPTKGVTTNIICDLCKELINELGGWVDGRNFGF
jgi:RHS repeat-associated protein